METVRLRSLATYQAIKISKANLDKILEIGGPNDIKQQRRSGILTLAIITGNAMTEGTEGDWIVIRPSGSHVLYEVLHPRDFEEKYEVVKSSESKGQ